MRLDKGNMLEVMTWMGRWGGGRIEKGRLRIYASYGVKTVQQGDWIVRHPGHEFWPCRDDIFRKFYKEAE
jgi:hypothetical protein